MFCQSSPSQGIQQFLNSRHVAAPDQSKSNTAETFRYPTSQILVTSRTLESFTSRPHQPSGLSRFSRPVTEQEITPVLNAFSYKFLKVSSEYFPIKLGPLRYTFWPCTLESDRPAGGRLQRVVDGFLKHYTSGPIMPQTVRCLRALSCTSFYQQTLRQRDLYTQY